MRIFRQFDYFRKSTSPEAIKATVLGGIISLSCIATLAFLIYNELQILWSPEIVKNTTVSTDPNKHPHIIVNMDITFPNVPCYLLEISQSTSVNSMEPDEISKQLVWAHKDKDDKFMEDSPYLGTPFPSVDINDEAKTEPLIKKFMDDGWSCNAKGRLDVTKVTGEFDIHLKGASKALQLFNKKNKEDYGKQYKLQINHKINSWTFGSVHAQELLRNSPFGKVDNGQHTMFNMFIKDGKVNEDLKTYPEAEAQDYFYFLKVVPHTFVDFIEQSERNSYSYSLAHNKKSADKEEHAQVILIIDYAPVKMVIQKQQRPIGQFMINMCSIVGGVFVIFGLINSMLLKLLGM